MDNEHDYVNVKVEDLIDPITGEFLADPITLPCCGKNISRSSILEWFNVKKTCPTCNADLNAFDVTTCPTSVNMAYLVEQAKKSGVDITKIKKQTIEPNEWTAKFHCLCNNQAKMNQTVIGRLTLKSKKNMNYKTLFIPVLDVSGSMAGSPCKQCIYSIGRIVDMTCSNKHLVTKIVTYSDSANMIDIDSKLSPDQYHGTINSITAGGGTSFASAFKKVVDICKKYDSDDISSLVIMFLTDGEDSSVPKELRHQLTTILKHDIEEVWKKKYIIHTIGFGGQHDFDFLSSLQKIGTSEGAYRYADPSEDTDSLSNKINSILDVVVKSRITPIKVTKFDGNALDKSPIISGDGNNYWVNLTGMNLVEQHYVTLTINDTELTIPIEMDDEQNNQEMWHLWYSYLTDNITSELLLLSDRKEKTLDMRLHCEILEQRINAIMMRMNSTIPTYVRLEKLLETLKLIESGDGVDKKKLHDMKFEGTFVTTTTAKSVKKGGIDLIPDKIPSFVPTKFSNISWNTYSNKKCHRFDVKNSSESIWSIFGNSCNSDAIAWMDSNLNHYKYSTDTNGSDPLMVLCTIGRHSLVKYALDTKYYNLKQINKNNFTALDLAAVYGYWKIAELLISYGAVLNSDPKKMLMTCLSNNYMKTAELLTNNGLVTVDDDFVNASPTRSIAEWAVKKNKKEVPIAVAIEKGMYDTVNDKVNGGFTERIVLNTYKHLFENCTTDHVKIFDLLLKKKLVDPMEIIKFDDNGETGITWPLFELCQHGNEKLFKVFIKYYNTEMINYRNHNGTTALWIATCNGHTDIVVNLLDKNADPNLMAKKSGCPLIPACQKGYKTIVELLLNYGASLESYVKTRDNPILICCRSGQSSILDYLFGRMTPDEVNKYLTTFNDIDGFVPLIASTELDNIECIKVCHKYKADLNIRTNDDNKIIQGATAVHLACFYGRLASLNTLYELGADFTSKTTVDGYTPLHIAIKQGQKKIVKYLLMNDKGKECLNIVDNNGRLPAYYANIEGNQDILNEFFTNKLSYSLLNVLMSDAETEKKCISVIENYGQSLGCYEHDQIVNTEIGQYGMSVGSMAMLNGNKSFVDTLRKYGMDMQKPDEFGITPEFWACYLGYDNKLTLESSQKMLENVSNKSQSNIQNKMLLGLSPQKLQITDGNKPESSIVKMSDSYDADITEDTLEQLKESLNSDHSLLGFLEKLKNNKLFPEGEQYLKYIVFDAKVNVIRRVASGENLLQPNQIMALYLYTGNYTIFKQVNSALKHDDSPWTPIVNCLYSAINKLPPYVNEVYRSINKKFTMDSFAIGKVLSWNSFSLGSSEWKTSADLIAKKTGVIFIIHSKSGRLINKYSKHPADNEVMFLPGTKFVITNHYRADPICLGQANIRQTTFKMKEHDYNRPLNGDASIIIELDEL